MNMFWNFEPVCKKGVRFSDLVLCGKIWLSEAARTEYIMLCLLLCIYKLCLSVFSLSECKTGSELTRVSRTAGTELHATVLFC